MANTIIMDQSSSSPSHVTTSTSTNVNNSNGANTITGTVYKRRANSRLGISFRQLSPKHVGVGAVRGKFKQKTDLVPGLIVLRVNNEPVDSSAQAALLIRTAPVGNVLVTTQGYCCKAKKLRRNQKTGISLQNDATNANANSNSNTIGGIKIARVDPKGLFSMPNNDNNNNNIIQVGQRLVSVNGRPVSKVQQAIKLLMQKRKLTLIVVDPPTQQPTYDTIHVDVDVGVNVNVNVGIEDDDDLHTQFSDSHEGKSQSSSCYWSKSEVASAAFSSSNWTGGLGDDPSDRWVDDDNTIDNTIDNDIDNDLLSDDGMLARGVMDHLAQELQQAEAQFATRVVVSVIKPTQDTPVGITFRQTMDHVFLHRVDPKLLFGATTTSTNTNTSSTKQVLKSGQRLVSINGDESVCQSVKDAMDCLRQTNGRVTIETMEGWGGGSQSNISLPEHVLVQVQKPDPATSFGLCFSKRETGIAITGISMQGLMGSLPALKLLLLGQTILMVNGLPCPESTPELIQQLQDAFPMVSLECQNRNINTTTAAATAAATTTTTTSSNDEDFDQTPKRNVYAPVLGKQMSVVVPKPPSIQKVGISLRKSCQIQSILIAGITEHGLLAKSGLVVGQKILSINGIPCPSSTVDTIQLIQQAQGTLTIDAAEVDWSATLLGTAPKSKSKSTANRRQPTPATHPSSTPATATAAITNAPCLPIEISFDLSSPSTTTTTTTVTEDKEHNTPGGLLLEEEQVCEPAAISPNAASPPSYSADGNNNNNELEKQEEEVQELSQLLGDFEAQLQSIYNDAAVDSDDDEIDDTVPPTHSSSTFLDEVSNVLLSGSTDEF